MTESDPAPTAVSAVPVPPAASSAGAAAAPYRWRWRVLALVLAAECMDLLDATVVTIAGPHIRADIGGSESTLQWLITAYTLALAVGLVVSGRLGDRVGRRRMFVVGALGFTVASLLCGLAWDPASMIGFRVLQGGFGAVMIPQGLALIRACFPAEEMGKAFAAFGPVMGLAAVLGPVLSGVLVDADLFGTGWRMIFLVNLPVGAFAVLGALRWMPELREPDAGRLDPWGVGVLSLASLCVFFPLVQGRELDWPGWVFAVLAAGAVLVGVFVLIERGSDYPVVPPTLFGHRGYVGGTALLVSFNAAMLGLMLVFNAFTQYGLGYDALHAGLALVPWSLGIAVGAPLGAALVAPRLGRSCIQLGTGIAAAGMLLMWWTVGDQGLTADVWDFVPATVVAGLGCGLVFAPLFDFALADVTDDEAGSASGLLTATQQLGSAAGAAVVGTVFFQVLESNDLLAAMRVSALLAAAMFLLALAVSFLLPRHARAGAALH